MRVLNVIFITTLTYLFSLWTVLSGLKDSVSVGDCAKLLERWFYFSTDIDWGNRKMVSKTENMMQATFFSDMKNRVLTIACIVADDKLYILPDLGRRKRLCNDFTMNENI